MKNNNLLNVNDYQKRILELERELSLTKFILSQTIEGRKNAEDAYTELEEKYIKNCLQ